MFSLKQLLLPVLLLILSLSVCESLNVLIMVIFFGRSHSYVYEPIATELVNRGHNVTMIVNVGFPKTTKYRVINIADEHRKDNMNTEIFTFNRTSGSRMERFTAPLAHAKSVAQMCDRLDSEEFKMFIKENNNYDVIVAEVFNTNCFYGLSRKYNAPLIGVTSSDLMPWTYQWFGSPENPSYIPILFLDHDDQMTFFGRLENTLMLVFSKLVHKYLIANPGNEYSKKYLGIDLYEGGDILYNISLLLTNRHFTMQTPKPFSPNIIEVGGIHIQTPKSLPEHLSKIVEKAPNGVIYMSMGSILKGSSFPEDKRKIFLKVFSKLKQTVIWKWENETMDGLPKNVKIEKWIPQLDLLCNPNVKLFITHGGLLGSQESVYCGVPMLMLPMFADQHYNGAVLSKTGATKSLKLNTVTEELLFETVTHLLSPDVYKNAAELSERFKDRPMTPLDTAMYWIEYIAKHKGAPYMKPAVANMYFYQYLLLDVIGFIMLVLAVITFVTYISTKFIFRTIFLRRSNIKLKKT